MRRHARVGRSAKHFFPSLTYYDSLDRMLEHEIDAVMVATPAFQHTSDAIAALNADIHVLSEVTACWTMAEAVALYEAAHQSKAVYSFGENYCYFYHMLEMKKLYAQGVIGSLNYADCSYYAAYRGMWVPFCKHKYEWRRLDAAELLLEPRRRPAPVCHGAQAGRSLGPRISQRPAVAIDR